jgi:hypothetical protein
MKIELVKASGKAMCRNRSCKCKIEFINPKSYRIKKDTTCAAITMESAAGWNTSYYCRDCIEIIYEDMKKILNPKLWIFM